jgi:predicted esterase
MKRLKWQRVKSRRRRVAAAVAVALLLGAVTTLVRARAEVGPAPSHADWRRTTRALGALWRQAQAGAPAAAPPRLPVLSARLSLRAYAASESSGQAVVFTPLPAAARRGHRLPLVMMLHGACGRPLPTCGSFRRAGREGSWLLCPGGNTSYRGYSWECRNELDWYGSAEDKASFLDETLALFEQTFGDLHDPGAGDILMGFSRGAFVARDVVMARPGRWRGLILIGAWLEPAAADLRAAGIRRVVMMAGQHDDARPAMERAVASLNAAGLPARFIDTGPIWHQLPEDPEPFIRAALDWVRRPVDPAS